MKIFFRNIHLYLSLAAGLVIMIACLTGTILVFEKELQSTFSPERYYVEPGQKRLPLEELVTNVKKQSPEIKVSSVKLYPEPNRTVEIGFTTKSKKGKKDEKANQTSKKGEKPAETKPAEGSKKTAFVNPYTGEVIELYSYRETFFYKVFALHRWLLGGNDSIGKLIVGTSTLIFLFILLTGLILWWPKTRKMVSQRLKIKWDGNWKRLTHDFHIVFGFYTSIFLFIFAFTGLAWSFQWFNKGIYKVTNSEMNPSSEPPLSAYHPDKKALSYDEALQAATAHIREVAFYNISAPKDSSGVFNLNVLPASAPEMATDTYYLDQYSGEIIGSLKFNDKNLGQRVRATFKPVHTGSIFGIYSKIIAFISCLLGATFPITGCIMWINRINKKKKSIPVGKDLVGTESL